MTLPAASPSCVHCGFCLPACPTWRALGDEMDTPRGRLMLIDALRDGRLSADDPQVVRHLDLCLGCRACETACPSAVPYGRHLEEARELLFADAARPAAEDRLARAVLAGVALPPGVQGLVARVGGALARALAATPLARGDGRVAQGLTLLARGLPPGSARAARLPRVTPAQGPRRMRVALLLGCVQRWMFGPTHEATARLLSAAGCEVVVPPGQRCCGALHAHSGDRQGARRLVRANLAAFARAGDFDALVVNAAGCGSHLRDIGELFGPEDPDAPAAHALAARTRDALQLLDELGLPEPRRALTARVALHDACHLAHAQGIRAAPRRLLGRVPGLELVPLADADRCCGSAGLYNVLHPQVAGRLGADKAAALADSGALVAAAANPGCLLQIRRALDAAGSTGVRVAHPLDLLDEACRP